MSNILKQDPVNSFIGLNKDAYYNKQPTYVLNGILESFDGEQGIITTEESNFLKLTFPENHVLIGKINMSDNELALFTTDETNNMIHLFKNGNILNSYSVPNLNLSKNNIIQGVFKIIKGCERVIYWNDNHRNPDRYFNFDDLDSFKTNNIFDYEKFNLTPKRQNIDISVTSVNNSGGNLELGQYFFQVDVLDSNFKEVYSSLLSSSVIIYDDLQNESYNQIDGGYNYPNYSAEIGGVLKTNKSITLNFNNVDTKYSYLKLKVLKYISGDGVTKSAHVVNEFIPITNNSLSFIYTGMNVSNGDYSIEPSELLIVDSVYESSSFMEQVQNRLVRSNVKEKQINYSSFQQFANQIQTNWTVKLVDYKNSQALGDSKNPLSYQEYSGYMSDEIYAFGIIYVLKDGTLSPVFHIPGRSSNSDDTQLLTVGTDISLNNVLHINSTLTNGSTIEKWKVYNTAPLSNSLMGYYEDSQAVYPNTTDCDGNYIWGNLRNQKIRHHRFPDRQRVPLVTGDGKLQLLGIEFSNINYPTNVIGHYFVKGKRDDFNKTVLDNGYLGTQYNQSTDSNLIHIKSYQSEVFQANPSNQVDTFLSPKTYLLKENLSGTYFNICYNLKDPVLNKGYKLVEIPIPAFDNTKKLYVNAYRKYFGNNYFSSSQVVNVINNRFVSISKSIFIKEQSYSNAINPISIFNTDTLNSIYACKTISPTLTNSDSGVILKYGSIKQYKSVYSNIFNISYSKIGNLNQNVCFNGDVFISNMSSLFGYKQQLAYNGTDSQVTYQEFSEFLIDLLVESDVNFNLRHSGTNECSSYYKNNVYNDSIIEKKLYDTSPTYQPLGWHLNYPENGDMAKYYRSKYMTDATPDDLKKDIYCTEFVKYNLDYNKISNPQLFFPIQLNFEYCSDCLNEYKQRIIYSEKSFSEEMQDAYLIFKTNNYIDLPANRGEITGLKYKENNLLVHTKDSTFILKPNPQILTTNQTDVILGTGDFLSLPPQELLQTDLGYAGCQSRQGMCNTPYGYCWVDEKLGQIFMYNNSLEDLTQIGLSNWFYENLKAKDMSDVLNYPLDNPFYNTGVILYFDPRYKRLLLTKHNYKNITNTSLAFNGLNITDGFNTYDINNTSVFENKSFTISFAFKFKVWDSYHSYISKSSFSDDFCFYTSKDLNALYSHNKNYNYREFYNVKQPFVVEYFTHDFLTKELQTLDFVSQTKNWDSNSKTWLDNNSRTFNKLWCYNRSQSTGILTLNLINQLQNPFDNLNFNFTNKTVIKTDKNYKISSIYSNRENSPTKTNDWSIIKNNYPIDYLPTQNEIIEQLNIRRLKDKECYIRFIKDDTYDMDKLSLYLTNKNDIISIR